jgi:hypothetical protein
MSGVRDPSENFAAALAREESDIEAKMALARGPMKDLRLRLAKARARRRLARAFGTIVW